MRPGLDKLLQVAVGILDHQVDIEGSRGQPVDGSHNHGAEGDIRHEMTVHHIDVQAGGAGSLHHFDLLFQLGEVSAEQTW